MQQQELKQEGDPSGMAGTAEMAVAVAGQRPEKLVDARQLQLELTGQTRRCGTHTLDKAAERLGKPGQMGNQAGIFSRLNAGSDNRQRFGNNYQAEVHKQSSGKPGSDWREQGRSNRSQVSKQEQQAGFTFQVQSCRRNSAA